MDHRDVMDVVQAAVLKHARFGEQFFDPVRAVLGQRDGTQLLIFVVDIRLLNELHDHIIDRAIKIGAVICRTRDNERGPRLVDQDAVHLIHDRVVERTLHHVGERIFHIVAQVVETELVIRAVGDVRGISLATLPSDRFGTITPVVSPRKL